MRFLSYLIAGVVFLAACSRGNQQGVPLAGQEFTNHAAGVDRAPAPTPGATLPPLSSTVTLWHSWSEGEAPVLVQAIAEFQTRYPQVQFDVNYVPADQFLARLETASAQGKSPTLWFGPADWGPRLFNSELLADLSDKVGSGLIHGLNQAAVGAVLNQHALIGLPYAIRGVVLYRNRGLISKPPATFDELVALAQSATRGDILGADLKRSFYFSGAHLNGLGGSLMDERGAPTFDNAAGLAWVELLRAFEKTGPTEFLSDHDLELFEAGKVGFIIDDTQNMKAIAQALGAENLAIDPWPAYRDGHLSGYVQSDILYMSSKASDAEQAEALKFMEYFLSPAVQGKLTQIGKIPAAHNSLVTEPLVLQAMAALAGGTAYPVVPQMATYAVQMDLTLKSIFEDGADPASALEAAAQAIRAVQPGAQTDLTNPTIIPAP